MTTAPTTNTTTAMTVPQWRAVSTTQHRSVGWKVFADYRFAAGDAISPLLAAELGHAVACFPIGFTAATGPQANGRYELVALLSLQPGVNLYVDSQGQWLAPYVPSHYRSYPFRLLQNEQGEHLLCVDEASALFSGRPQGGEQRLFDDQGDYTQALRGVIEFLQQRHNNQLLTQTLTDQLAALNLIVPWALTLATDAGPSTPVQGVFRIDEAALQALPGAALATLAQSGALALAYAQLLSIPRLNDFERRYQQRSQDQARHASPEINLDALFGEQGETLKFGF